MQSEPTVSRGVRLFVVGLVSSVLRGQCLEVDPEAVFVDTPGAVCSMLQDSPTPVVGRGDAVVVVSTALDSAGCREIIADETRLPEPLSLGFVVNADEAFVGQWLARLRGPVSAPAKGQSAAFLDDALVGLGIAGVQDVRGANTSRRDAAEQAKTSLACVIFYGHSNGQCHGAGGLAVCQRDRHQPRESEERQLPCFGGAPCRFDTNDAVVRVPADDLKAQVVIDFTCFGYVIGDHTLLGADAVGKAMMENRHLQALVTSLRAFGPGQHDYGLAAYLAQDGCEMGRLATALNRARVGEVAETADLICLGDPRATLERTVQDGGETSEHDITIQRPDGAGEGACDIRVATHPPVDEVLLFSGASAAAWAPDGRIYLTLPAGRAAADVLRLPTATARMTMNFEPLIPCLDFLEHHLDALQAHPLAGSNEDLGHAIASAESARSQLRRRALRFHPGALRNGSVFDANTLGSLSDLRAELLESLVDAMVEAHRHTLTARSLLFVAGADTLSPVSEQFAGPTCGYCGAGTTHVRKGVPGSRFERTVAFCDLCGRLFEGAGFATSIEVEPHPGRWTTRVKVTNGFPFEVPVRGVAAIQTFSGRHCRTEAFAPTSLEPGASVVLSADIPIHKDVPPGAHRAKAAICVGPQIELLLRNALLRPSA